MLKKRETLRAARDGFNVDRAAACGDADRQRLLADVGIHRNRLKVEAAIHNARVVRDLRDSHGGFADWLAAHHPLDPDGWKRLFRKSFRFTGGEIANEFLMSLGDLPGAHRDDCPVMRRIRAARPPWMAVRV